MYTHIARTTVPSLWGTKYRLSIRLYADPEDLPILHAHHLDRIEVFADPLREDYAAAATAAHDRAKARGLFVTRARDTTAIAAAEMAALVSTLRGLLAFNVRVGDLLRGVTVEHRSLRAISDIETVCVDVIDRVAAAVHAARGYDLRTEEVFAPGTDQDETVPPGEWTRTWRR